MGQERTCSYQDTLRHVDEVKRQVRAAGKDVELGPKFNMTLQVVVGRKPESSKENMEHDVDLEVLGAALDGVG
ncbi:MAG: hypothetical protein Q9161_009678 [Pseudevernia consocians]